MCSYHGMDKDVIQGQDNLDNEMCMFVGYYYPIVHPEAPLLRANFEGCGPTLRDMTGVGTKSCVDTAACMAACPASEAPKFGGARIDVGPCYQKCAVDSCANASAPLVAMQICAHKECADKCAMGNDDACKACVNDKCADASKACQAATCGAPSAVSATNP
jgi:hypothetical protein